VLQQKTQRPVQFEITPLTREAVEAWIKSAALRADDYPFRVDCMRHRTLVRGSTLALWTAGSRRSALIRRDYGTHSIRRTKPTLIYRRTRNLRAVQLLLGHTKLESTVRYLGIEVDGALDPKPPRLPLWTDHHC
jgi:integrase